MAGARFRTSLLCILVTGMVYVSWNVTRIGPRIETVLDAVTARSVMRTSWESPTPGGGCTEHEVITPKEPGESPKEWAARHQTEVMALQALYPPK